MQSVKLPNFISYLYGRSRTVCVIGAGVSGLHAAGLLAGAGFQVTILEARDRIGGRLQQTAELGALVDLGASWIHGTEGNPLVALAEKAGSTTTACGAVYSICTSNGSWLPRDTARAYYQEVWEILDLAIEKSQKEHSTLSDDVRMMDFFRQEVSRRYSGAKNIENHEILLRQIAEMWGAFMGNDCERQSLKNLWLDSGLEGDNLFVASTYQAMLANLRSAVGMKTTIRLQCEVTRVTNNKSAGVDIVAADGFRGHFDNVIVTAPLGWLKRNMHVFSPPLPNSISNAVQSLGYGNLEKVFIKFPKPFWNDEDTRPDCDQGLNDSQGKVLSFPVESLFLSPDYASDTNPAKWRLEIISFSGLPEPFSQPIIMFFVYGQWGRHITGLVRGLARNSKEYYRILDENFRPYYSKLPRYTPDSPDCAPLEFLSTDWQNDRFAGYGSYTSLPVGSGNAVEHFEALRSGMGKERGIWFAGEHTSTPNGLGTIHGAYWSGEEVAKRVASRYDIALDVDGLS
ncbi:putative flavin-containing amine oxidase [Xylaria sp. FL1777]|nr:putative flavin-containing amine oxidase [Xylaria sp. FL1777]